MMQQPPQVLQRVRHALQKMRFALVKSAKSISAQRLHDAHINVGVVMPQERFAIELYVLTKRLQIMVEQVLAQFRRQIGLRVEQKRSSIVLQRALAAALIIPEEGPALTRGVS